MLPSNQSKKSRKGTGRQVLQLKGGIELGKGRLPEILQLESGTPAIHLAAIKLDGTVAILGSFHLKAEQD